MMVDRFTEEIHCNSKMNTGDGQLERIGGSPQISLKKDDPIEHGIVSPNPVEKK